MIRSYMNPNKKKKKRQERDIPLVSNFAESVVGVIKRNANGRAGECYQRFYVTEKRDQPVKKKEIKKQSKNKYFIEKREGTKNKNATISPPSSFYLLTGAKNNVETE